MARTGQNEAQQNWNTTKNQQGQAFGTGQAAVAEAKTRMDNLAAGKQAVANPWMNPNYLAAVTRATSGSLNAANDAGAAELRMQNRRSGGMNGTATAGAISDLALRKMRLGDQLTAERTAQDWNKNVAYQATQAEAPLEIARTETPYYSTGTSGMGQAAQDLTQFGLASYGPYEALIQAAGQGVGAALKK